MSRIAAIQMTSCADVARNLSSAEQMLRQAHARGAIIAALPENFAYMGLDEADKLAISEAPGVGPIQSFLSGIARELGLWVVAGTIPMRLPEEPRVAAACLVFDGEGRAVARYDKIHLFDVDIPGGAVLRESDSTARGGEAVVVEIAGAPVGVSICYDVRFPELYRRLVKDLGAEVLLVPAAFTAHTGGAHWHLLLRARAIEEQAWVVAPAQWGRHSDKRESYGHTLIADPWGAVVGERAEGDGVVVVTLDGETVARRRAQMPCLDHAVLWSGK
jgi:deaminated glutathione amidase